MADTSSNLSALIEKVETLTVSFSKLPDVCQSAAKAVDKLAQALGRLADRAGQNRSGPPVTPASDAPAMAAPDVNQGQGLRKKMAADVANITAVTDVLGQLHHQYGLVASAQSTLSSLGVDAAGVETITQAAKAFANTWSGTSQAAFLETSYRIKDGIANLSSEAVADFTRIATLTAGATNTTTEQMTHFFTQAYHAHRTQFDQFGADTVAGWEKLSAAERDIKFGEYLSQGISASVQTLSASGDKMREALSSLGTQASEANIPFAEQLAVLSELQKSAATGQQAGKQYASFINNSTRIGEALKLQNHGDGPLSTAEMMTQLRSRYGDNLDQNEQAELLNALGSKMGGPSGSAANDSLMVIKKLLSGGDSLSANTEKMQTALGAGMSVTEKMAKDNLNGPNEALVLMQQRFTNLAVVLGETLAPVVTLFADLLGQAAMMAADLAERFPLLTQILIGGAVAFVALKTAMLGIRSVQLGYQKLLGRTVTRGGQLSGLLQKLSLRTRVMAAAQGLLNRVTKAGQLAQRGFQSGIAAMGSRGAAVLGFMRKLGAMTRLTTLGQWALNIAMSANPIGLIIAGVVVLSALLGGLIYKYFEPIKAFFSGVWQGLASSPIADVFRDLQSALAPLGELFSWIGEGIVALFDGVMSFFEPVKTTEASLQQATESGKRFGDILGTVFRLVILPIEMVYRAIALLVRALMAAPQFISEQWHRLVQSLTQLTTEVMAQITAAWDGAMSSLRSAWQAIKVWFSALCQSIKGIWQGFTDFFTELWQRIALATEMAWQAIKVWFSDLCQSIKGIWAGFTDFFTELWQRIALATEMAWQAIKNTLSSLFSNIFSPLADGFSAVWDGIVSRFHQGIAWISETLGKVGDWWHSLWGDEDDNHKVKKVMIDSPPGDQPGRAGQTASRSGATVAATGIQPVATGLSANTAGPSTYAANYQIHIQQQPGEQGEAFAHRLQQELNRHERAKARHGRTVLYDQ